MISQDQSVENHEKLILGHIRLHDVTRITRHLKISYDRSGIWMKKFFSLYIAGLKKFYSQQAAGWTWSCFQVNFSPSAFIISKYLQHSLSITSEIKFYTNMKYLQRGDTEFWVLYKYLQLDRVLLDHLRPRANVLLKNKLLVSLQCKFYSYINIYWMIGGQDQ